jgi:two-component system, chemotaxis family, sensor kinase CheA
MDEIVNDFLIESKENLDRLDQELVKLESEPSSKELLASIFRTIHTIKGSCGFLGFTRLEKVTHAGESLLSRLRDGLLTLNVEITSGLLAMVDAVRHMLGEIQATEHDGEDDYPELREKLTRLQGSTGVSATPAPTAEVAAMLSLKEANIALESPLAAKAASLLNADTPQISPADPEAVAPSAKLDPGGEGKQRRPTSSKLGVFLVERGSVTSEALTLASWGCARRKRFRRRSRFWTRGTGSREPRLSAWP